MSRNGSGLSPALETGTPCSYERHEYIAREGEVQRQVLRVEQGWACRYRLLNDGRRHIVAFFLPGDLCEPQWMLAPRAQHAVVALTRLRARAIPISSITAERNGGMPAMLQAIARALNVQAEWIVSLGCKTATERLCELLCDIFCRMQAQGLVHNDSCAVPLTQYDIADAAGLTPVHVNRVLKLLRARKLLELRDKILTIPDPDQLRRIAALPAAAELSLSRSRPTLQREA